MRVVVVAEHLRRQAPGGIGTYLRGLVGAIEGDAEVTLLAGRPPARSEADPVAGLVRPVVASRLPGRALTMAWNLGLPAGRATPADGDADVVFAPSLAAPPPGRAPLVVAVHDLAWRRLPEAYPSRGRRWHDRALARAAAGATAVFVPSEATAAEVAAAGVPAAKVQVVDPMYGCDHLPAGDRAAAGEVLEAAGVTGPYLLAVGTLEPRKNLGRLVDAYRRARPFLPDPWPLLLVGPAGWGIEADGLRAVDGVRITGPVTDAVLAALYAGARCVAYVPLFEGWGLPAVEAMAAAVPVVASPVPSSGGAALEVDPLDADAIAAGLVAAAGDDRRRSELVTAGLLRAAELTWKAAAGRHVELWREVAQ